MVVDQLGQRRGDKGLFPHTVLGWSAVGLAVAIPVFYLVAMLAVAVGLATTDFAPAVVGPLLLAVISAVAALTAGAISIGSGRDRSLLVFLAAAVGLVVFGFVAWTIFSAVLRSPQLGPPGPPPGS